METLGNSLFLDCRFMAERYAKSPDNEEFNQRTKAKLLEFVNYVNEMINDSKTVFLNVKVCKNSKNRLSYNHSKAFKETVERFELDKIYGVFGICCLAFKCADGVERSCGFINIESFDIRDKEVSPTEDTERSIRFNKLELIKRLNNYFKKTFEAKLHTEAVGIEVEENVGIEVEENAPNMFQGEPPVGMPYEIPQLVVNDNEQPINFFPNAEPVLIEPIQQMVEELIPRPVGQRRFRPKPFPIVNYSYEIENGVPYKVKKIQKGQGAGITKKYEPLRRLKLLELNETITKFILKISSFLGIAVMQDQCKHVTNKVSEIVENRYSNNDVPKKRAKKRKKNKSKNKKGIKVEVCENKGDNVWYSNVASNIIYGSAPTFLNTLYERLEENGR